MRHSNNESKNINIIDSLIGYPSTCLPIKTFIMLLSCFSLFTANIAHSEDTENADDFSLAQLKNVLDHNWQITGFGTIGYTHTNKYDDRLFRRNVSQDGAKLENNGALVDSRLGIQVKGDLTDQWEIVLQGVLKEQYAKNWSDYIDVAFARYRASDAWQFTFGRQPFDLFILSDHINVGYSYDFVRPPTEFYGYLPYDSFDGLGISRKWGDFDSEWSLDLSVGNLKEEFDADTYEEDERFGASMDNDVGPNDPGNGDDETRAEPIYNTALNWRSDKWHLRTNFAILEFKLELDGARQVTELLTQIAPAWQGPMQAREAFLVNNKMHYFSIGGSWQDNNWKVQSEFSVIDADFAYYNGERAYLHVSRRYNDWLPYVTLGYANDDSNIVIQRVEDSGIATDSEIFPLLVAIQADLDKELVNLRNNQHSLTLGARWDFASRKAFKFQCDRYWFQAGSGSTHGRKDALYLNDETRTWCSLNLDWVF